MRIALLTRRLPPQSCGVGDYAWALAGALERRGHEVILFVASRAEAPRPAGHRVVELQLDGWGDVAAAQDAICAVKPDVVQLEYSSYGWDRFGCAFWMNALVRRLHRRGVPVCIALHELPIHFRQHPALVGVALAQRLHFRLLLCASAEVVSNTPERVRILRRRLAGRGIRVSYRPNSSNIPVVPAPAALRAELRAARGAIPRTLVAATFGMYDRAKNFEAAVEAVAQVRGEFPAQLWLLGDTRATQPAYLARLKELARARGLEAHTWWPGRLDAAELSAALQAADVFLLPQADGHLTRSSAFMAAAAHGLAAVAVRNSENQAEFAHGENVWTVDSSRSDDFAAALRRLAGDASLRERLGRNLRALYESHFSWDAVLARQYEAREPLDVLSAAATVGEH